MVAVAAAALTDQLRHDLSPAAVPIVGRGLLATLVDALPRVASAGRPRRRPDPLDQRPAVAPAQPLADHPGTQGGARGGPGALAPITSWRHRRWRPGWRRPFEPTPTPWSAPGWARPAAAGGAAAAGRPARSRRLLREAEAGDPEAAIGARLQRTRSAGARVRHAAVPGGGSPGRGVAVAPGRGRRSADPPRAGRAGARASGRPGAFRLPTSTSGWGRWRSAPR